MAVRLTWRQQADTTAVASYPYAQATVLQRFAYAYDPAGNRTAEQMDDTVTSATHDSLNRLVTQ